jgi:uncharacterized membrane protein
MSYQEKRTIAYLFAGFAVLLAYCIYAFGKVASGEVALEDMRFWSITMLIFIGIRIFATIIILIIFNIIFSVGVATKNTIQGTYEEKEIGKIIKAETTEDERDRQVESKSSLVTYFVIDLGLVAGLVVLALNGSIAIMLNVFFLSFLVGSFIEGFAKLILYRRG